MSTLILCCFHSKLHLRGSNLLISTQDMGIETRKPFGFDLWGILLHLWNQMFVVQVHRARVEREILEKMDHPFLPTLYGSFQVIDDKLFLVTAEAG